MTENLFAYAVGSETFSFEGLLRLLTETVGAPVRLVGLMLRDVALTKLIPR